MGRFPEAVLAAELGVRAARAGGDGVWAESIRQPLEFYKQHKPFCSDPRQGPAGARSGAVDVSFGLLAFIGRRRGDPVAGCAFVVLAGANG